MMTTRQRILDWTQRMSRISRNYREFQEAAYLDDEKKAAIREMTKQGVSQVDIAKSLQTKPGAVRAYQRLAAWTENRDKVRAACDEATSTSGNELSYIAITIAR